MIFYTKKEGGIVYRLPFAKWKQVIRAAKRSSFQSIGGTRYVHRYFGAKSTVHTLFRISPSGKVTKIYDVSKKKFRSCKNVGRYNGLKFNP